LVEKGADPNEAVDDAAMRGDTALVNIWLEKELTQIQV
jgi:hypothetical protein